MQKLEQKQDKKINLKLFVQSIKSEQTKRVYLVYLNKYLHFPGSEKFLNGSMDPRKLEEHIINFVISMKKEGKGFAAIHNYISAICKFYKVIDVILNADKINQYLPEFRRSKKNRAYTHGEIQSLLDIADERMRCIILLLASSGIRVGAIPDLRIRNTQKVSTESGFDIHKLAVYENTNDEYVTFTSSECSTAIDNYLKFRENKGERLTPDSFLIREQFDVRDPFAISKSQQIKPQTISKKLIDLAERSGLRQKEVLGMGKRPATIRKDVPVAHGYRKFFTTQLVEADVKTELRWLLEGHKLKGNDSHYVRTTDERLQQEYEKALDNLTIDPANRLRRKVETLKIEKSRIDMLEAKIQKLERKYRR
jgi:integrase